MANIILYSKKECHLCEIAKEELEAIRKEIDFSYRETDIEKDKHAFEKFKYLIPVLEIDGTIISTYKVDGKKLKEILKQKP